MTDEKAQVTTPPPAAAKAAAPTSSDEGKIPRDLLKLVQRPARDRDGNVVLDGTGPRAKPKLVAIGAKEVFAWRDRGDRVVVVTTDGQKYSAAK